MQRPLRIKHRPEQHLDEGQGQIYTAASVHGAKHRQLCGRRRRQHRCKQVRTPVHQSKAFKATSPYEKHLGKLAEHINKDGVPFTLARQVLGHLSTSCAFVRFLEA